MKTLVMLILKVGIVFLAVKVVAKISCRSICIPQVGVVAVVVDRALRGVTGVTVKSNVRMMSLLGAVAAEL